MNSIDGLIDEMKCSTPKLSEVVQFQIILVLLHKCLLTLFFFSFALTFNICIVFRHQLVFPSSFMSVRTKLPRVTLPTVKSEPVQAHSVSVILADDTVVTLISVSH